jgi:hypothetical protein
MSPLLRAFAVFTILSCTVHSAELLDDRAITLHSDADIAQRRNTLIQYLWGTGGFPTRFPDHTVTNIACPLKRLEHLKRVDELRIDMAPGLEGLAWHFLADHPNGELVVVHHGHACTLDDDPSPDDVGNGMWRTIQALLREGYGVLGVFMPHMRPGDCTGNHEGMFEIKTAGSPIKCFLEPTALSLNYLKDAKRAAADQFPLYKASHMIGLSGGGWTTTVYAALDSTIRCSFPVAGSIPLYLRSGGSIGDREQFEPSFYRLAGYPDLYILGATGPGRKQVQVLVRRDDCCFGVAQHDAKATGLPYADAMREYETRVQATLKQIGGGSFRLEIDEKAPSHMISHSTIEDVLVRELKKWRVSAHLRQNAETLKAGPGIER